MKERVWSIIESGFAVFVLVLDDPFLRGQRCPTIVRVLVEHNPVIKCHSWPLTLRKTVQLQLPMNEGHEWSGDEDFFTDPEERRTLFSVLDSLR